MLVSPGPFRFPFSLHTFIFLIRNKNGYMVGRKTGTVFSFLWSSELILGLTGAVPIPQTEDREFGELPGKWGRCLSVSGPAGISVML